MRVLRVEGAFLLSDIQILGTYQTGVRIEKEHKGQEYLTPDLPQFRCVPTYLGI